MKLVQLFEATIDVDTTRAVKALQRVLSSPSVDYIETPQDAVDLLNSELNKENITVQLDPGTTPAERFNPLWVKGGIASGVYDPNTDELIVYVVPGIAKIMKNPERHQIIIKAFESIIAHELVHREQRYRAYTSSGTDINVFRDLTKGGQTSDNDDKSVSAYLSDPHEIMAMAHEIIRELEAEGFTPAEIFDDIRTGNLNALTRSARFRNYMDYASNNRLVFNRLRKNMANLLASRMKVAPKKQRSVSSKPRKR